jgi:5-methylcytosine-specific restriction endonuclease McrA
VSRVRPKRPRLQIDRELYDQLRNQVLRRDGWRCQSCGTMSNLEVHHKTFRSQAGHDSEQNLVALCTACHARVHHRYKATNSSLAEKLKNTAVWEPSLFDGDSSL